MIPQTARPGTNTFGDVQKLNIVYLISDLRSLRLIIGNDSGYKLFFMLLFWKRLLFFLPASIRFGLR